MPVDILKGCNRRRMRLGCVVPDSDAADMERTGEGTCLIRHWVLCCVNFFSPCRRIIIYRKARNNHWGWHPVFFWWSEGRVSKRLCRLIENRITEGSFCSPVSRNWSVSIQISAGWYLKFGMSLFYVVPCAMAISTSGTSWWHFFKTRDRPSCTGCTSHRSPTLIWGGGLDVLVLMGLMDLVCYREVSWFVTRIQSVIPLEKVDV